MISGLRGSRSIFWRMRLTRTSMLRSYGPAARPCVRSRSWSRDRTRPGRRHRAWRRSNSAPVTAMRAPSGLTSWRRADDPVDLLGLGGEHQDRHVRRGPQAAAQAEAVLAGQHQVEDHEIDAGVVEGLVHGGPVARHGDAARIGPEIPRHEGADLAVVLDHEDVRGRGLGHDAGRRVRQKVGTRDRPPPGYAASRGRGEGGCAGRFVTGCFGRGVGRVWQ